MRWRSTGGHPGRWLGAMVVVGEGCGGWKAGCGWKACCG